MHYDVDFYFLMSSMCIFVEINFAGLLLNESNVIKSNKNYLLLLIYYIVISILKNLM